MKRYINKYFSIFSLCLFFSVTQGFAQESYLLKELRIPQVAQENPGAVIPYDAHVSFPGLGKVHVGVNIPLSYGDIFYISDELLKKMGKNNAIRTWVQNDPIHFGFRSGKNYFSITTAVKTDFNIVFQKDILALVIEGNNEKKSLIKDNFLSFNSYAEFGLGYNREVNENISFGVNAKYLLGFFNAYTQKADISLISGENYHELVFNQNMQGKFAGIYDIYDVLQNEDKQLWRDVIKKTSLSDFKNHGFSLDLGGRYKINNIFEVSASVLDIGFIKWKSNPYEYNVENESFSITGYDFRGNIFENTDSLLYYVRDYFVELGDSLLNNLDSEIQKSSSYTKWLNTRFNIGGAIYASPKDRFNLNFRGLFINGDFIPSGSVSYTRNCGRWFDVVVGNTFKPNALLNPGLGVNFTLEVFQLYALVDYSNTLLYIDRIKNLNVIFGINFVAPLAKKKIKASYPY